MMASRGASFSGESSGGPGMGSRQQSYAQKRLQELAKEQNEGSYN